MKMRYYEAIDIRCVGARFRQVCEIGKFPVVLVTHVHPTVQHNIFTTQCDHDTTPADILARP